jgi:prepilin peptidase CpaA
MDTYPLMVATAAMAVLMAVVTWYDLKYLRIPNWSVLAVAGVFVVTGLWGLPLDTFLWHLLYGVIVLVLGFLLYSVASGHMGGGDIKLIAALTPFIAAPDLGFIALVYALLAIVGLMIQRFARAIQRDRVTGWKALDQKRVFPAGLLLGGTIMIYLAKELAERFYTA